ncbi:MAG: hypothetical protein CMQ49_11015 [Gammaproteobacteria bacterium]|nr:hypothetical protein [Gammaproteobacteria bacterium]
MLPYWFLNAEFIALGSQHEGVGLVYVAHSGAHFDKTLYFSRARCATQIQMDAVAPRFVLRLELSHRASGG